MLLTANASPICNSLELVRMELYLRGLQMATKWSKDMMRSTEDSMSVNLWIKKFLGKAGIHRNPHGIEQEDPQHGGKRGERQTQVRDG